ncbi:MAG: hypothetical protein ACKO1I_04850, partial [Microcystis aeruginosa]
EFVLHPTIGKIERQLNFQYIIRTQPFIPILYAASSKVIPSVPLPSPLGNRRAGQPIQNTVQSKTEFAFL